MKKKVLIALMTAGMILTAVGCGNSGASAPGKPAAESTEAKDNGEKAAEAGKNTEAEKTADDAGKEEQLEIWVDSKDWNSITENVEPLNFAGLGLSMPMKWEELVPYIDEAEIKGALPDRAALGDSQPVSAEEMADADLVLYGLWNKLTIQGILYDFGLGLTKEEERTKTFKECLGQNRFTLGTEYARVFFGIPEDARPSDAVNTDARWLMDAIVQKYGKPQWAQLSDEEHPERGWFVVYWERDGYYFGLRAQDMSYIDNFGIHEADYIPASAWEAWNEGYNIIPFDEYLEAVK